jgi:hypothetical protein
LYTTGAAHVNRATPPSSGPSTRCFTATGIVGKRFWTAAPERVPKNWARV